MALGPVDYQNSLIKVLKRTKTNIIRDRVKNFNVEIKRHSLIKKSISIRRKIIPGNSKSLWDAVKIAKDTNNPKIPDSMSFNGQKF